MHSEAFRPRRLVIQFHIFSDYKFRRVDNVEIASYVGQAWKQTQTILGSRLPGYGITISVAAPTVAHGAHLPPHIHCVITISVAAQTVAHGAHLPPHNPCVITISVAAQNLAHGAHLPPHNHCVITISVATHTASQLPGEKMGTLLHCHDSRSSEKDVPS